MTTLLLMPLLVYPLLSMSLNRFLVTATAGTSEETPYTIGVASDAQGEVLLRWLDDPMSQPPPAVLKASGGQLAKFRVVNTMSDNLSPVEALKQNQIDLACEIQSVAPPKVHLTAYNGDASSGAAMRILTERLQWLRMARAEFVAKAVSPDYVPPAEVTVEKVGKVQERSMLGTIVPLVLVLMTITGAVYPAIDLTAGERERGTMESLMASPVRRSSILFSKYVAVVVVALLTAVANLFAMFTTLWAGGLLPLLTGGSEAFPWLAVLQILGLLVLFSGFFAALLLSLTSFARSFKEAQAYLIPIMLLSLTPGMLSLMPGVSLNGPLAIAPLVNIVLLAREVLQGTAEAGPAVVTILSTVGYAAAAIAIASRLFGSDAVTRTSQQSFGTILRRPEQESAAPSPQTAAVTLALLVPIYYLVSNVLIRIVPDLTIEWVLVLNAFALALTFGLIPYLAARLSRCRPATTYRWRMPPPLAFAGALLIGLGAWGLAHEAFVIAQSLGIGGLDADRIEKTKQTVGAIKEAPAWLLVVCLALAPAVVEELCFRGFLFSSLGKVLSPGRLILATAIIFGLFHVVTGNMLLIERFVPTTLLGLMLGWLAYRSGSVLPGMLMHLTHNGLLILATKYEDKVRFLGAGFDDQLHLPPSWMAVLTLLTVAGFALLWIGTPKPESTVSAAGAWET
ncbi:CPBP family intramembrane metalloprotease [Roseiconus nitratireducens]|uniref:CPBP family intramembrane metalloprotease n=1 Tax=Roseiconus nitratireducens TaxID=2605748 RepID=A0A5M6CX11_9BACT|nr:CPBP family intramembrane metalloprotease [Roseiconus nitratireducens]